MLHLTHAQLCSSCNRGSVLKKAGTKSQKHLDIYLNTVSSRCCFSVRKGICKHLYFQFMLCRLLWSLEKSDVTATGKRVRRLCKNITSHGERTILSITMWYKFVKPISVFKNIKRRLLNSPKLL